MYAGIILVKAGEQRGLRNKISKPRDDQPDFIEFTVLGVETDKIERNYADDSGGMLIEPYHLAHHCGIAGKMALPEAIAKHGHGRRFGCVVNSGVKESAINSGGAKITEVVGAHQASANLT